MIKDIVNKKSQIKTLKSDIKKSDGNLMVSYLNCKYG